MASASVFARASSVKTTHCLNPFFLSFERGDESAKTGVWRTVGGSSGGDGLTVDIEESDVKNEATVGDGGGSYLLTIEKTLVSSYAASVASIRPGKKI